MSTEIPELKPCPFCGGRAKYLEAWGVQCVECEAGTPCTFYEIDEIWNTRTPPKVKPISDIEVSRARAIIIGESGGYWHPSNDMVRRILSALE